LTNTECTGQNFLFHAPGKREIAANFDGGSVTSDAGALLLRETEHATAILRRFAECFSDYRRPQLIEHTVSQLVSQRVIGLCLGYDDLNDHDELRRDPLFASIAGKVDPTGAKRRRKRDRGCGLAGKSTLNRLELGGDELTEGERYKKITLDTSVVDDLFIDLFLEAHPEGRKEIILDLDATDVPLHGHQEGRFYHGYYGEYCYLPLYTFCDGHLLGARLRSANVDASSGAIFEIARIVERVRAHWPDVKIMVRGDSGFCREDIMAFCEAAELHYVFGLAKNDRLKAMIEAEMDVAKDAHRQSGEPERVFADLRYRTRKSWSCERRVVAKAEHLMGGANPRFVVTNLTLTPYDAPTVYEDLYCARGDMENRIKEQQLGLFADRLSTSEMKSNELRLYLSSIAYTLMHALRRLAFTETSMETWQCGTIRSRILKIGARVRVTTRRIWVLMSSAFAYKDLFEKAYQRLAQAPPFAVST